MRSVRVFFALSGLLVLPASSFASSINGFDFTAMVNSVSGEAEAVFGPIAVGSEIHGRITWRANMPLDAVVRDVFLYRVPPSTPGVGVEARVGGSTVMNDPASDSFTLYVADNPEGAPFDSFGHQGAFVVPGHDFALNQIDFFMNDFSGSVFNSGNLPTSFDLADFDAAAFNLLVVGSFDIRSDLVSLTMVPEPSVFWSLISLGLIGMGVVHWQRKRYFRAA